MSKEFVLSRRPTARVETHDTFYDPFEIMCEDSSNGQFTNRCKLGGGKTEEAAWEDAAHWIKERENPTPLDPKLDALADWLWEYPED